MTHEVVDTVKENEGFRREVSALVSAYLEKGGQPSAVWEILSDIAWQIEPPEEGPDPLASWYVTSAELD